MLCRKKDSHSCGTLTGPSNTTHTRSKEEKQMTLQNSSQPELIGRPCPALSDLSVNARPEDFQDVRDDEGGEELTGQMWIAMDGLRDVFSEPC